MPTKNKSEYSENLQVPPLGGGGGGGGDGVGVGNRRSMFLGATPPVFRRAKELRNHLTDAEMTLWNYLRTHPQGYKFRRQHPIGNYVADFYCHKLKLIIEVDGSIHSKEDIQKADRERQQILETAGIKVMRFINKDLLKEKDKVISTINNWIAQNAKTKI